MDHFAIHARIQEFFVGGGGGGGGDSRSICHKKALTNCCWVFSRISQVMVYSKKTITKGTKFSRVFQLFIPYRNQYILSSCDIAGCGGPSPLSLPSGSAHATLPIKQICIFFFRLSFFQITLSITHSCLVLVRGGGGELNYKWQYFHDFQMHLESLLHSLHTHWCFTGILVGCHATFVTKVWLFIGKYGDFA